MHKDFRRKGNIAECEAVKAILLPFPKISVKPVGLVALMVEDEEGEWEVKKKKNKEEITPDWSQVLTLKKTTEEKIKKEGVIGIGSVGALLGVAVGIVASSFFRKD
ncbi:uncharacterized protein [Nicotiana tomentosiformis]|uniref:uncharacterized protein n=1 Tax=Nicotiana tomentosiformis TaxID=4098 RepID=UPI00051BB0F2|nr:uncharacterized protein LOC104119022 [Nicotiana tomentosiformis]XP_033508125.1 uncharacterized protein LOC104119022 [Nicotiana tomentosiformis]